jgi:hypothetical protein
LPKRPVELARLASPARKEEVVGRVIASDMVAQ